MGDGGAPSEGWMPLLIARPGDDAHESDESDEDDYDDDDSSSSSSRRRRRGRNGGMQRLLRVTDTESMQEVPPPTAPAGREVAVGGWEPLSPRPTGAGSGFFGAGRSGSRTSASAAKLQPVWLAAVAGRVYFRERRSEVLAANEVAVLSACDLKLECVLKLPTSLPGVRLWPQCEADVS
eukprot:11278-Heterococcus_DN1.PRE.1